jgi:GTP-binding protein Era
MSSNRPTRSPSDIATEPVLATSAAFRCGYVALVGRPNAGKSTLFNALVGQRLSIVTAKPQTTRGRLLGILTLAECQLIFLDTPGLLDAQYALHEHMKQQVSSATKEADLILLLFDATRVLDRPELVTELLQNAEAPVLPVLNKTDLVSVEERDRIVEKISREFELDRIRCISALSGENVQLLAEDVASVLPEGPKLYPDEMIAEQPERFFAAEIIREAAFNELDDELPYAVNVAIEEFSDRNTKTYINSILYVERESQRGIVIGKKGGKLREIGRQARLRLEDFLQHPVYLDLWVRVRPKWRSRDRDLKEFGYR